MAVGFLAFMVQMMRTPDEALRKADPCKLAARYGVPADWAAMTLTMWLGRGSR